MQWQREKSGAAVLCPDRQGKQDDARECWNCIGTGHLSPKCPKPNIGDGLNHKPSMNRSKTKIAAKPEKDSEIVDVLAVFGEESLVGAVTRLLGVRSKDTARCSPLNSPSYPTRFYGSSIVALRT